MALVDLFNKLGLVVTPFSWYPVPTSLSASVMNAVGESVAFLGKVYLSTGPGTSKTISSAGGKIWVYTGAVTWATAGSTLRVGIQDPNAAGDEDGTFDTFGDLVQGVDAISANSIKETAMSSGTKTIAHGDWIAVVVEMTVRNGADSVALNRYSMNVCQPYTTNDTGAGVNRQTNVAPICAFETDDGTLGHFGDWTLPAILSTQALASNTTPDEYALVFEVPFDCSINGLFIRMSSVNTTDTATMHIIEDPFGADSNLQSVTLDPILFQNTSVGQGYAMVDITEQELTAGTVYAISYRPTNTNSRTIGTWTYPDAAILLGLPLECSGASRSDLGSWSASSTIIPDFGIRINKVETGSGGGASSAAYVG